MNKYTLKILVTLRDFNLQSDKDIEMPYFLFSNNTTHLTTHFFSEDFVDYFGTGACDLDRINRSFAWQIIDFDEKYIAAPRHMTERLNQAIFFGKLFISQLIFFTWFIRDNSSSVRTVYGVVPGNDGYFLGITENSLTFTATGHQQNTNFTQEDLLNTLKYFEAYRAVTGQVIRIDDYSGNIDFTVEKFVKSVPDNWHYNLNNRIDRALFLLGLARINYLLPSRIASYIQVLECLFSTDKSEATQKISERAAFYGGNSSQEKQEIYDIVRIGYSIRSDFFHGNEIGKKFSKNDTLAEISLKLDNILRRTLSKILMEDAGLFLLANNEFEQHMKYIIFR